ncbi:MAG: radical SAM protein, partial [Candidatus Omnitrophica bacterium]|nr:radical SAM protein [Candidatus Omnitrophota bacterium]
MMVQDKFSEKIITLINLPGIKAINSLGLNSPNPPIGLAYIAAILKKDGYNYKVIDMAGEALDQIISSEKKKNYYIQGLSLEKGISLIPENTDIIGFSCIFSPHWPLLRDLVKQIRQRFPDIFMVAGGEHITALPEFSLKDSELDAIVLGEGELIFPSLIKALRNNENFQDIKGIVFKNRQNKEIVINQREKRIMDLDSIPWPDWDSFPIEEYIKSDLQNGVNRGRSMPIVATRGCPHRCSFCSNMKMWTGIYKVREPSDVVSEMEDYIKKYDVVNFNFQDLTAFVDKHWTLQLAQEILSR